MFQRNLFVLLREGWERSVVDEKRLSIHGRYQVYRRENTTAIYDPDKDRIVARIHVQDRSRN